MRTLLFSLGFVLFLILPCATAFLIRCVSLLQKELIFAAVMKVLDEPPTFSYYHCYCLVRDHSFQ